MHACRLLKNGPRGQAGLRTLPDADTRAGRAPELPLAARETQPQQGPNIRISFPQASRWNGKLQRFYVVTPDGT